MIRNVVFDIGNVLAAFRWKEYFADFGYPKEILERLYDATVRSPIWSEFDRGEADDEKLMQLFIQNDPGIERELRETLSNVHGLVGRYDYAIPWIQELKTKGYRVYYLSNFARRAYEDCLDAMDFIPYMDGGILSFRDRVIKPSPEIYQLLLSRYGLKAEECVFLDDLRSNVDAARQQGWQGIVFEDREQACRELREMGVDA